MLKSNMTARFTDENILKVSIDHDNGVFIITMLDENGDEVDYTIDTTAPAHMTFEIVNDLSSDLKVLAPYYATYGMEDYEYIIPAGESVEIPSGYGTPDNSNYITAPTIIADNITATGSNLANCTTYGSYYLIIDPTEDAYCKITVTES